MPKLTILPEKKKRAQTHTLMTAADIVEKDPNISTVVVVLQAKDGSYHQFRFLDEETNMFSLMGYLDHVKETLRKECVDYEELDGAD